MEMIGDELELEQEWREIQERKAEEQAWSSEDE